MINNCALCGETYRIACLLSKPTLMSEFVTNFTRYTKVFPVICVRFQGCNPCGIGNLGFINFYVSFKNHKKKQKFGNYDPIEITDMSR